MLDGYLCGVLVQPRLIEPDEWLPPVFDLDGAAFPASADAAWRARCEALITRRYEALREALLEDGGFDPLVPEDRRRRPARGAGRAARPRAARSRAALMPWVAGFEHAAARFPELEALPDDDVQAALAAAVPPSAGADRTRSARWSRCWIASSRWPRSTRRSRTW